ncbi:MAG: DUF309 domain-containing protein [Nitrospirae bacterium]|nr:DUF309 domain-containing protein [Candidatus Manganitrophaceae bacterium]
MILSSPIPDPPHIDALPWYSSNRSLPSYRFVPGVHPHPIRNPLGHSYREIRAQRHPPWLPEEWKTLEAYLRGVDLFNRFYFWEAHEGWEALWKSHRPDADPARFIQGLINLAASLLKLHMRQLPSSLKLWRAAAGQLDPFRDQEQMGIDVDTLLREVDHYLLPMEQGILPELGSGTPVIRLIHINE